MDRIGSHLHDVLPALLFLCAGVPLAALLDRLGYFDAVASTIEGRFRRVPVAALWWLAAATTVVLNLDTTVVLLTPLYIRLALRSGVDPIPLALIPLLLASLASSVLPVSNLTTLIAAETFDLSTLDVLGHLGPTSVAACLAGWLAYRRRHPTVLPGGQVEDIDVHALRIGTCIVAFVLCGFVVGPALSIPAWLVALGADVVLIGVTRWIPWRHVPVATALGVACIAALIAVVVPADAMSELFAHGAPSAVAATMALAVGAANIANNLPALLAALGANPDMTWGMWAWLAGVNTGAVLLPIGALANLLWLRILRAEDLQLDLGRYVREVTPIALPALAAGVATLTLTRVVIGA